MAIALLVDSMVGASNKESCSFCCQSFTCSTNLSDFMSSCTILDTASRVNGLSAPKSFGELGTIGSPSKTRPSSSLQLPFPISSTETDEEIKGRYLLCSSPICEPRLSLPVPTRRLHLARKWMMPWLNVRSPNHDVEHRRGPTIGIRWM